MVDDTAYGIRDSRGHFTPINRPQPAPLFRWPPQPAKLARWFFGYPGYLLPWNAFLVLVAIGVWLFLTPSLDTLKTFEIGWIAYILVRNAAMTLVFYSAFHWRLYQRRAQNTQFKYNPASLSENNPTFLFGKQTADNMFWTFASGVPIWTAYEVVSLWLFANGFIPFLDPAANPVWFVVLLLVIPLFREFHFYCVHRLIHWPPLYRSVHKLHHLNVNPGPWSSLSMHPVEHLLYFSGAILHWVVLSHPLHMQFHLIHAGLGAIVGHIGYEKIVIGGKAYATASYPHYLHHKYFEVNYADGGIPLDKWFGTWHDGSPETEAQMNTRLAARAQRLGESAPA